LRDRVDVEGREGGNAVPACGFVDEIVPKDIVALPPSTVRYAADDCESLFMQKEWRFRGEKVRNSRWKRKEGMRTVQNTIETIPPPTNSTFSTKGEMVEKKLNLRPEVLESNPVPPSTCMKA
jgi:hypothetical protein